MPRPSQTHFCLDVTQHHPLVLELDGESYEFLFSRGRASELEEELGRPMNTFSDWLKIDRNELGAVLKAGLEYERSEEEAYQISVNISDSLSIEAFDNLVEMVSIAAFPQAVERHYGVLQALRHGSATALEGEVSHA